MMLHSSTGNEKDCLPPASGCVLYYPASEGSAKLVQRPFPSDMMRCLRWDMKPRSPNLLPAHRGHTTQRPFDPQFVPGSLRPGTREPPRPPLPPPPLLGAAAQTRPTPRDPRLGEAFARARRAEHLTPNPPPGRNLFRTGGGGDASFIHH